MLSLFGLIAAVLLLIVLTVRGMNLFVATPLCALIIAVTSGLPLLPPPAAGEDDLLTIYMAGFTSFISSWFFMFLLGAVFGKLMEDTGAADSIAAWVLNAIGAKRAALAVVLASAILTYGGVSLFVVAFSVYPTALSLFRAADLPRRFIPATLAFGSVTFTMTSAGSPEIQNWIPIRYLGTSPWAAWEASLLTALFMAASGYWWLNWMLIRARARGEKFAPRIDDEPPPERETLPKPGLALLGPFAVLLVAFVLHERLQTLALLLALLSGCLATVFGCWRHRRKLGHAIAEGSSDALLAIGNTSAVVGFGQVAKAAPAFMLAVDWVTGLPGSGVATAALAVSLIAALTGSASGGQAIALPLIAPHYLALDANPEHLHRAVAISSGVLDSLPHNGYVVTTIRAICKETHAAAYAAVGALTVIVPGLGLLFCLLLFTAGL